MTTYPARIVCYKVESEHDVLVEVDEDGQIKIQDASLTEEARSSAMAADLITIVPRETTIQ